MPPHSFKLPEAFKRLVFVGNLNDYGATCAACAALSPFLHPSQKVFLTNSVLVESGGSINPMQSVTARARHQQGAYEADVALKMIKSEVLRNQRGNGVESDVPYQYFYGHTQPGEHEVTNSLERICLHTDGPLPVRPEEDLLVYVLNAAMRDAICGNNGTANILEDIFEDSEMSCLNSFRGHVLIITDDDTRCTAQVDQLVNLDQRVPESTNDLRVPRWVVVRTTNLGPPALEFSLTKCSVMGSHGLVGMLESICAAVALGVLTDLPVRRSDNVPSVPLDVAVHTGLVALMAPHYMICQRPPTPTPSPLLQGATVAKGTQTTADHHVFFRRVVLTVDMRPCRYLVWGMFGEYLLDYYGRYACQVVPIFPATDLLSSTPAIHFVWNALDVATWGVKAVDAQRYTDKVKAKRLRSHLLSAFPNKKQLLGFFSVLDSAVLHAKEDAALRGCGAGSQRGSKTMRRPFWKSFPVLLKTEGINCATEDSAGILSPPRRVSHELHIAYADLVAVLDSTHHTVHLRQYVSLDEVDWGMYIRCVTRSALQHLALHWLSIGQPSSASSLLTSLPKPTRSFVGQLVYTPTKQPPLYPSVCRRILDGVNFAYRAGLNACGRRVEIVAGMNLQLVSAILTLPHIQRCITATANAEKVSEEEITRRAESLLWKIGDTQNQLQCRVSGWFVHNLLRHVYHAANINAGAYERLMRLNNKPRVQLVYIPLHRSYTDFLIMYDLLISMNMRPPHIAAGEDFLQMGKFAELLRGSGAFFLRRSFRGDLLYTALLKEYVRQLVLRRLPIEFFIEGMRSRTGATMPPKMGLLKFITDAFFSAGATAHLDDVLFVPVSLSYNQLMEAKLYVNEILGIPKPSENITNMIMAATKMKHQYGSIHMHFGEAISLQSFYENPAQCPLPFQPKETNLSMCPSGVDSAGGRFNSPLPPVGGGTTTPRGGTTPRAVLAALTWRITYDLQHNIVITPAAVVASAIGFVKFSLEHGKINLPRAHIEETVLWLAKAVSQRNGNLCSAFAEILAAANDDDQFGIEATALKISSITQEGLNDLSRFVRLVRGEAGSSAVMYHPPTIASYLGVRITANQLVHLFADEAVLALVAHGYGEPITSLSSQQVSALVVQPDVMKRVALLLRRLLAPEFPNLSDNAPYSIDSWLKCTLSRFTLDEAGQHALAGISRTHGSDGNTVVTPVSNDPEKEDHESSQAVFIPATPLYRFLLQLILPQMDALYLVCVATRGLLDAFPSQPLPSKVIETATQKAAVQLLEEGGHIIQHAWACNFATIRNAFSSLLQLSILQMETMPSVVYVAGTPKTHTLMGDGPVLLLNTLIEELHVLRRNSRQEAWEETKTIQKTVLRFYAEVCQNTRL